MTICYFTATGNCLYVARRIGGELRSIPHMMKDGTMDVSDDAVGIVCPVYAGQMPGMVRKFIEKVRIRTDYLFFVYTYGMSESVARPTAVSVTEQAGLKLNYVNSILMVDNYLPGFEVQKQLDTAAKKNIEGQIEQVCKDIADRKQNTGKVTLLHKIGMAAVHGTMAKAIHRSDAAKKYIVNDNCVKCGICAKVCPADNIKVTDVVSFSDHCEVCYACVHNCPKNAIHLKAERSEARFRNEHVTLKDIIASNE